MLRGSEALMDVCREKIHHEQFHTNEAGTLSLGGGRVPGRLRQRADGDDLQGHLRRPDAERLGEIIDAFEAGKGDTVKPGPQVDRWYSAPQSGFTTLTDEKAITKAGRARAERPASGTQKGATIPPSKSAQPPPRRRRHRRR